ncbi:AAA family ATPase [Myxococcota bacterium]|nr:AAA family ATPase [Myxococcota bacterium]
MIEKITLKDFLSYGEVTKPSPFSSSATKVTTTLEMRPLNVLVGPNASGKSNFVEALALLRAAPKDLPLPIRNGGGVAEWIWRGDGKAPDRATVEVTLASRKASGGHSDPPPYRYRLTFGAPGGTFRVLDELIDQEYRGRPPEVYFATQKDGPVIARGAKGSRVLEPVDIDSTQSILSQRKDPENFPTLTKVGEFFGKILIYRSWTFGPDAPIRSSCLIDVPTATLAEDFSNLPARLAVLKRNPATKRRLLERLAELDAEFTDLEVTPEGGRLQLYLIHGDRPVPASRLSDGTLRALALLAILIEPGPASVVVIEEPALGLHPDMLPTIGELLVSASEQAQLIVTTHSSDLLDALTKHAESVVLCERQGASTALRRLGRADIKALAEFDGLGAMWMSGSLGVTP